MPDKPIARKNDILQTFMVGWLALFLTRRVHTAIAYSTRVQSSLRHARAHPQKSAIEDQTPFQSNNLLPLLPSRTPSPLAVTVSSSPGDASSAHACFLSDKCLHARSFLSASALPGGFETRQTRTDEQRGLALSRNPLPNIHDAGPTSSHGKKTDGTE